MPKTTRFTKSKLLARYQEMENERSDFDPEYKKIIRFLMPGHGNFQSHNVNNRVYRRRLTNKSIVNNIAQESQQVLDSGMQSGITPPSRPWYKLAWFNKALKDVRELTIWLEDAEAALYDALAYSNFYQMVAAFYKEFTGFGMASMYFGDDGKPFNFSQMTVGEYVFAQGAGGRVDELMRIIFLTYRQVVEKFGKANVPDSIVRNADSNPNMFTSVLHAVVPDPFMKTMPFTSLYFPLEAGSDDEALQITGNWEFPYMLSRWDTIGTDNYALGPGSVALPDIQRLQEMEKAFLMGSHKSVNPPLNAPARKRGQVKSLPGGINYYNNPNEVVSSMYNFRPDFSGVGSALERAEMRIRKVFFNDIFLTASRDPNLSPLKAAEVNVREDEKMLRLGPVVERTQYEFLQPLVERGINILIRRGIVRQIPEQYYEMMGDSPIEIKFVSVLSQGQKMFGIQPINSFLQFLGGAAQLAPTTLDKLDSDALVDEYADLVGVTQKILLSPEMVRKLRQDRAAQMAKQQQEENAAKEAGMAGEGLAQQQQQADIAKTYSDAGTNLTEVLSAA